MQLHYSQYPQDARPGMPLGVDVTFLSRISEGDSFFGCLAVPSGEDKSKAPATDAEIATALGVVCHGHIPVKSTGLPHYSNGEMLDIARRGEVWVLVDSDTITANSPCLVRVGATATRPSGIFSTGTAAAGLVALSGARYLTAPRPIHFPWATVGYSDAGGVVTTSSVTQYFGYALVSLG